MLRHIKYPLLIICFILLATACSGNRSKKPLYDSYDIRLMQLDPLTEEYIHYILHRRVRLPSGQLKGLVTFVNQHETRNISVDWKIKFYDSYGFELEETAWNSEIFPPRQETTLNFNSISNQAVDFMIIIRGAQI